MAAMHAIAEPCPICGSLDIRRSRRQLRDALEWVCGRIAVRCMDCDDRYFVPWHRRHVHGPSADKAAVDESDIVIRIHRPSRLTRALLLALCRRSESE